MEDLTAIVSAFSGIKAVGPYLPYITAATLITRFCWGLRYNGGLFGALKGLLFGTNHSAKDEKK